MVEGSYYGELIKMFTTCISYKQKRLFDDIITYIKQIVHNIFNKVESTVKKIL